jgi:hypothetical protein
MNWRQIGPALHDYFGGVQNGDVFTEIEAYPDWRDEDKVCDGCPPHTFELNLTELAKHIADHVGGK